MKQVNKRLYRRFFILWTILWAIAERRLKDVHVDFVRLQTA